MQGKMIPIELSGLNGSSPIGALAAFGLLRVCSEIESLRNSRLAWSIENQDDWTAVLFLPHVESTDSEKEKSRLINLLVQRQPSRLTAMYFQGSIEPYPDYFRSVLFDIAKSSSMQSRDNADYCSAFGSEVVTFKKTSDKNKEHVKPTMMCMVSGQQDFLKLVRELSSSLVTDNSNTNKIKGATPVEAFTEALFGPWVYRDDEHHLGFDPSGERLYALRYKKPGGDPKRRSVRAGVWLAIEAMPLFPTVANGRRLATTGFERTNRKDIFSWPVWTDPIGIDTLRSLLASSELYKKRNASSLSGRGIAAIYQSVRSTSDKGYGILRPSELKYLA